MIPLFIDECTIPIFFQWDISISPSRDLNPGDPISMVVLLHARCITRCTLLPIHKWLAKIVYEAEFSFPSLITRDEVRRKHIHKNV